MTDERRRLMISITAAVIIHAAALFLTGMYSFDYETSNEYGPITVEIDLNRQPEAKQPEPEPAEAEVLAEDDAVPVSAPEPEPVPEKPVEIVKAQVKKPAAVKPVEPQAVIKTPEPVVDDDFLQAIRERRSDNSTVDARKAFGADTAAPATDRTDTWQASGSAVGSEIISSDYPVPERSNTADAQPETEVETGLISESVFSSLDSRLSSGAESDTDSDSDWFSPETSDSRVLSAEVAGTSHSVVFDDPSASRELLEWTEPEIPEDVQKSGVSEYKVVIEFNISSSGLVSNAVVVKRSGDTRIDAAVQTALRKWKFEESSAQGKNVHAILTYIIKID